TAGIFGKSGLKCDVSHPKSWLHTRQFVLEHRRESPWFEMCPHLDRGPTVRPQRLVNGWRRRISNACVLRVAGDTDNVLCDQSVPSSDTKETLAQRRLPGEVAPGKAFIDNHCRWRLLLDITPFEIPAFDQANAHRLDETRRNGQIVGLECLRSSPWYP